MWIFKNIDYRKTIGFIRISILSAITLLIVNILLNIFIKLPQNANLPSDGFLVLGGSVNREIHAAQLAKQYPQTPILISHGSEDPCILLIFQRIQAPINQVWLENCAESTFDNFFFALPILEKWQVKKLTLITSQTHLPRAKLLSYILLSSQGIWVDLDIAPETGVPGNQEFLLKTVLDVTRSIFWAVLSQGIKPHCSKLYPLKDVDLAAWKIQGFTCEKQAKLKY